MTLQPATERMASWLERAWTTRYLDRQLSSEELAWFEAYVLDKPELLAEIDVDTRLRDSLADQESKLSSDEIGTPATSSVHRGVPPEPSPIRRRGLFWVPLAASLIAGVSIGALVMRGKVAQESSVPGESTAPKNQDIIANPTRIVFDTPRSADERGIVQTEHKDSQSPYVVIEISVPLGVEEVRLHVEGQDDKSLLRSHEGFVSFLLPRNALRNKGTPEISYSLNGHLVTQSLHITL